MRCWDGRTGECVRIWRGHQGEIYDFQLSKDSQTLFSAGDDSTVMVWSWERHSTSAQRLDEEAAQAATGEQTDEKKEENTEAAEANETSTSGATEQTGSVSDEELDTVIDKTQSLMM